MYFLNKNQATCGLEKPREIMMHQPLEFKAFNSPIKHNHLAKDNNIHQSTIYDLNHESSKHLDETMHANQLLLTT